MANKKISELESRASLSLSDLMAVGDPSTGYLYKTTISDLKTLTGAGVVSFNGRFGTVNPAEGDYTLTQLGDVIITSPSNGQVLQYNGSNWVNTTLPADNDTLDIVTGRGNTTANSITVGSVTAAGLSNLLGQIRTFATTGNTYMGTNPASATDAGYKLDVNGFIRASQLATGAHSFRNEMYITSTTDGYTKQNSYNAASAFTMGFIGDLRFGSSTAIKSVFSFNGAYSNNGTVYSGDVSLMKIFTSDAIGNPTPSANINGYGINLMPTLNYTQSTSNFTGIYYNPTLTATTGLTHYAMNLVAGLVRMGTLAGTGSRMVVADASGNLSATTAIGDFVTINTTQTITGAKTFSNVTTFNQNIVGGIIKLSQGVLLSKSAAVGTDAGFLSLIATSATGLNYINIADGDAPSNTQRFAIPNTGTYTYTFPAASGTVALTSDIPSVAGVYLPLAGGTLTGALNGTSASFSGAVTGTGNAATNSAFIANNTIGSSGTAQYYTDFTAGATVIGRILRGNGASGYEANGLNIDNFAGMQIKLNALGGSGGSFNVTGGAATFSSSVTAGGTVTVNTGDIKLFTYQDTAGQYKFIGTEYAPGNGNNRAEIRFAITSNTLTHISFHTANGFGDLGERVRISSNGNVGINTTNPNEKLTVNGNGYFTGSGNTALIVRSTNDFPVMQLLDARSLGQSWNIENGRNAYGELGFYAASGGVGNALTLAHSTGNATFIGSIKTGEPDTGWGRAAIKIGASVSGAAFNVTRYLPVSVDGTIYYINLNSSTP
jgi:hypothetical protein